jgi:acyl carrier protein
MNKELDNRLRRDIINNSRVKIEEDDIHEDSNLINDFGYDSMLIINLFVELENEFNINFEDDDLNTSLLLEYRNLIKLIESKIESKIE